MDYEQIALYFAECIAATAHDFEKKSAPKGERVRHRQLCETVADILEGKAKPFSRPRRTEIVVDRLATSARALRRHEQEG